MATHYENRRKHPRLNVALQGRLERHGVHHQVRVTNLSEGGCFIETTVPVRRGERVHLVIHLSSVASLTAAADVVHAPAGGAGLMFIDLDPDSRAILESAWTQLARQ
jgi:hypothetical protein